MRVYNHVDLDRVKRELNRLEALKNKGFEDKIFTPISTPNLHQLLDKICRVIFGSWHSLLEFIFTIARSVLLILL